MLMKIKPVWWLVALLLVLPHQSGATVHNITVGNSFFAPLGTVVSPGDTVRWTWVGGISHSTTSDPSSPKAWDSGITPMAGTTFELVLTGADPSGPFPYHCTVHAFTMKDTLWLAAPIECFPDNDGDGYGTGAPVIDADGVCNPGFADNDFDCDDTDPEVGLCAGCCGQFTGGFAGNTDCDDLGKRNLSDITQLIDRVYVSKNDLCCEANGNVEGDQDGKVNLADITKLIDHVYVSKDETAACL